MTAKQHTMVVEYTGDGLHAHLECIGHDYFTCADQRSMSSNVEKDGHTNQHFKVGEFPVMVDWKDGYAQWKRVSEPA